MKVDIGTVASHLGSMASKGSKRKRTRTPTPADTAWHAWAEATSKLHREWRAEGYLPQINVITGETLWVHRTECTPTEIVIEVRRGAEVEHVRTGVMVAG